MALHTCKKCTARYPDDIAKCPQCRAPRNWSPPAKKKTTKPAAKKGGS